MRDSQKRFVLQKKIMLFPLLWNIVNTPVMSISSLQHSYWYWCSKDWGKFDTCMRLMWVTTLHIPLRKRLSASSLRGDKVSMLTHTYPHKPPRKTKVTLYNHQADSPLYVWPDVWSDDLETYGHTWRQMSLLRPGVIKQHKHAINITDGVHTCIWQKKTWLWVF